MQSHLELTRPAEPTKAKEKYVYSFNEGNGKNKKLLGGKGANLCEMTQIGLNVPPGFVISTEACLAYLNRPNRELPSALMDEVEEQILLMETITGKGFGESKNPLLVSVRSGSAMSMPGMMDTILNLGLNKQTLQGLIRTTNNPRFAYDAWRRFIQLYSKIAMGVADEPFDKAMAEIKRKYGAVHDVDLDAAALRELAEAFLAICRAETGQPFPENPYAQLAWAI